VSKIQGLSIELHATSDGQEQSLQKLQWPALYLTQTKMETHNSTIYKGKTYLADGQQLDGCPYHQATRGAHDYAETLSACHALQSQPPESFLAQPVPPGC